MESNTPSTRNKKDLTSAKSKRKFAIFSISSLLDVWRTSAPGTVPHVFLHSQHSQHFARVLVSLACHLATVDAWSTASGSFGPLQ
jgi:hypothetical protein